MNRSHSRNWLKRLGLAVVSVLTLLAACGPSEKEVQDLAELEAALESLPWGAAGDRLPEVLANNAGDWHSYAKCLELVGRHGEEVEGDFGHLTEGWLDRVEPTPSPIARDWHAEAIVLLKSGAAGEEELLSADFMALQEHLWKWSYVESLAWGCACRHVESGHPEKAAPILNGLFEFGADLASHGDLQMQLFGHLILRMNALDYLYASGWWNLHGAAMRPLLLDAGQGIESLVLNLPHSADRTAQAAVQSLISAKLDPDNSGVQSDVHRSLLDELDSVFAEWSGVQSGGKGEVWDRADIAYADANDVDLVKWANRFKESKGVAIFIEPQLHLLAQMKRRAVAQMLALRALDEAARENPEVRVSEHGLVAKTKRDAKGLIVTVHHKRSEAEVLRAHVLME